MFGGWLLPAAIVALMILSMVAGALTTQYFLLHRMVNNEPAVPFREEPWGSFLRPGDGTVQVGIYRWHDGIREYVQVATLSVTTAPAIKDSEPEYLLHLSTAQRHVVSVNTDDSE